MAAEGRENNEPHIKRMGAYTLSQYWSKRLRWNPEGAGSLLRMSGRACGTSCQSQRPRTTAYDGRVTLPTGGPPSSIRLLLRGNLVWIVYVSSMLLTGLTSSASSHRKGNYRTFTCTPLFLLSLSRQWTKHNHWSGNDQHVGARRTSLTPFVVEVDQPPPLLRVATDRDGMASSLCTDTRAFCQQQ